MSVHKEADPIRFMYTPKLTLLLHQGSTDRDLDYAVARVTGYDCEHCIDDVHWERRYHYGSVPPVATDTDAAMALLQWIAAQPRMDGRMRIHVVTGTSAARDSIDTTCMITMPDGSEVSVNHPTYAGAVAWAVFYVFRDQPLTEWKPL